MTKHNEQGMSGWWATLVHGEKYHTPKDICHQNNL